MSITNLRSSARFNQPRLVAADMHDRHPRRFEHTRDEQQSFKWHADPHSHEGHATCYQYIYTLLLKAHDGSMDCFNGNSKDPHNRHTCKMVAHAKPGLGNIDMLQVLKHYLLPRPCGSVKAHASHLPNVASPWRENDVIFVIKHPKSPNEVHSPLDLHVMLVDSLPQNAHTTAAETMIWELAPGGWVKHRTVAEALSWAEKEHVGDIELQGWVFDLQHMKQKCEALHAAARAGTASPYAGRRQA